VGLFAMLSFVSGHDFSRAAKENKDLGFRACVRTPFPNSVPEGRLNLGRDVILDNLQPSLRDSIMSLGVPRTSVLG
jgi:hypothetical protein